MEEKNTTTEDIFLSVLLSAVPVFVLCIHKLSKTLFLFASHIKWSISEQPKLSLYYYFTRFVTWKQRKYHVDYNQYYNQDQIDLNVVEADSPWYK
jgi:hypothetical protein